ncbi:MAG: PilZ domain-containing protein [Planctomycetes bacterium]|nr:PilZ domain-containing protein [Planctomycetota bacterium]MBI3836187.1 PilZ domain-containing protein [Planctomycetota bacterium]
MLATTQIPQTTQLVPKTSTIPQIDERRSSNRVQRRVSTMLTILGNAEGISCTMENVCESGAYLVAPSDSAVRLGDRCELILRSEVDSQKAGWSTHCDSSAYATIIRTETAMHSGESAIGVGLRFDQPLYL